VQINYNWNRTYFWNWIITLHTTFRFCLSILFFPCSS